MRDDFGNVKQQMRQCMLEDRNVKYQQELFLIYYDDIFPDVGDFQAFLSTSGWDSLVMHSKKIFDRLLFDSSWNGFQNMQSNLLNLEARDLAERENDYVSQNHTVHSVHLYILGIYLYFNYGAFHCALGHYFGKTDGSSSRPQDEESFLCFLSAWKTFSLLHDLAYPYETAFDRNGKLRKKNTAYLKCFENSQVYLTYEFALKYFAALVLLQIIADDSRVTFEREVFPAVENFEEHNLKHKLVSDTFFSGQKLVRLEYVHTEEDLELVRSLVRIDQTAAVVKNGRRDILAVAHCCGSGRKVYTREGKRRKKKYLYSKWYTTKENISVDYYVPVNLQQEFTEKLKHLNLSARKQYFFDLSMNIREKIANDLAIVPEEKSLREVIFQIRQHLKQWCTEDIVMTKGFVGKPAEELIAEDREMLYHNIMQHFDAQLTACFNESAGPEFCRKDLQKVEEKVRAINLDALCTDADESYYRAKEEKKEPALMCVEIFQKIYSAVGAVKPGKVHGYKDNMELKEILDFSGTELMTGQLEELLQKEQFIDSAGKLDCFLGYRPDHALFDHGIMAGIISAKFYGEQMKLKENLKSQSLYTGRDHDWRGMGDLQAVYAMLVHNIYNDIYMRRCGKEPKHNLLINPFSYFAMFCDNLQVWDRNKGINHGLVKWSGPILYGEDIGIEFVNDKILVQCRTGDIGWAFSKLKDGLDAYLQGASAFISLELKENIE